MIYVLLPSTPQRENRLRITVESLKRSACDEKIEIITEISEGEGAVKPVHRMLKDIDGLVVGIGDDTLVDPNTIQELYKAYIREFPNNDGVCAPIEKDCVFLTHSDMMKKYWYPGYFHLFVDREFFEIMYQKGKLYRVASAKAQHMHHSYGGMQNLNDETYAIAEAHREADGQLFVERMARNFDL